MFRNDFLWGAASSSYQIEGALHEDGRGESVWDEYCRIPGKIFEGHNCEIACDHYHRYREDVKLMSEMGLKAYRFSVAWPRIMPEGTGRVEPRGLRFYHSLLDELEKYHITPVMTISCWDDPAALARRGGWLNPESPKWYAEYVKVIAKEFGPRVKYFVTLNEPEMMVGNTYVVPNHAPGIRMSDGDVIRIAHNLMLAHGRAVQVLREYAPDAKIGFVFASDPAIPDSGSMKDLGAAEKIYFRTGRNLEELTVGLTWYSDPILARHYPEDGLSMYGQYLPKSWEKDLEIISEPLDFQGHNFYCGNQFHVGEDGTVTEQCREPGHPKNSLNWPVDYDTLYWGPKLLSQRYHLPIIITENGMCCHDSISLDGKVHDPNRIDYMHRYLLGLKKAVDEGIDVRGYFAWSVMDNFEWNSGFAERFGLVYIDHPSLRRIRKDSSYWYEDVIRHNGENL